MNWFKKLIVKWVREDWDKANRSIQEDCVVSSRGLRVSDDCVESDPVLNFKVYNAVGGRIVEFRRYDRQRDRNEHQTYIITSDQDFGSRIAKIATMENLKA